MRARVAHVRRPGPVDLMLIATIVIWAFNITVTRYVLTHGFRPLAYGSIRYVAAAAARRRSRVRRSRGRCGSAAAAASS